MREILFRGKRLDNGEWVEGNLFRNDNEHFPMTLIGNVIFSRGKHTNALSFDGFDLAEVDPATVGQFTGLLDKNGKRIFEGDILKDDWGKNFEVFFSTKTCSFMANLKIAPSEWETGNYRIGEAWTDTVKIVSNIHDNPELLEVGE